MAEWSRIARRIRVPLGFAFAILYFWLALPTWRFLALGAILIVPGLLIRALASGHVRKNEALATSGPYAYTRNPLYLGGNVFIFFGAGLALGSSMALLITALHLPLVDLFIRREERQLEAAFGEAWERYQRSVRRWL